jgi:hypothetical protein
MVMKVLCFVLALAGCGSSGRPPTTAPISNEKSDATATCSREGADRDQGGDLACHGNCVSSEGFDEAAPKNPRDLEEHCAGECNLSEKTPYNCFIRCRSGYTGAEGKAEKDCSDRCSFVACAAPTKT